MERRTIMDESVTGLNKRPGFLSDRLERTNDGKIRGIESKGRVEAACEENWRG